MGLLVLIRYLGAVCGCCICYRLCFCVGRGWVCWGFALISAWGWVCWVWRLVFGCIGTVILVICLFCFAVGLGLVK